MKRRTFILSAAVGPFAPAIMASVAAAQSPEASPVGGAAVAAEPGQEVNMMLLPKFLGIAVFDQANQGAQEAHAELGNPGKLDFVGPTAENSVAGQIEFVTNAPAGDYYFFCNQPGHEQIGMRGYLNIEDGAAISTSEATVTPRAG